MAINKYTDMSFNDFHWHDAVIKNITIDRSNSGRKDIIAFEIEWLGGGIVDFIFEEVYWANMNLNFGIVAQECILTADVLDTTNQDLINLYSKWRGMIDKIKLNSYVINLNSTGGTIKIISKGFKVFEK